MFRRSVQCYNTCEIPVGEIEVSILDVDGLSWHWRTCHVCVCVCVYRYTYYIHIYTHICYIYTHTHTIHTYQPNRIIKNASSYQVDLQNTVLLLCYIFQASVLQGPLQQVFPTDSFTDRKFPFYFPLSKNITMRGQF